LALLAVLGWPALATILEAFRYRDLGPVGGWARPLDLARETIRLVLATEALALPLGILLAVLLFRTDLWGRLGLLGLMVLAALVPMPLHAIGWLGTLGNVGRAQLFGDRPVLTGWAGAAVVHALAALPWVVLLVGVGLRSVESQLEEYALLDRPAWRVVGTVTLRRAWGAVAAAALMVAVLTAGDMTVTDLLQVRTYAEEAYLQEALGQGPAAMAIVTIPPLLILGAAVLVGSAALGRADAARLPSRSARPRLWRLGRWRVPLGMLGVVTVGQVMALPILGLVWRAGRVGGSAEQGVGPRWSLGGWVGSMERGARAAAPYLGETLVYAAVGATATVLLGWGIAWLARRPGFWRWIAALSVSLALASPAPVSGMALVLGYRSVPWLYNGPALLILAYVLRTVPYVLAWLWVALRTLPEVYFETAEIEGASDVHIALRVGLPLTGESLVVAWLAAFLLSLGELPASKLVEAPGMRVLSVYVWGLLHTGVDSHLASVGLVLLGTFALGGLATLAALRRLTAPRR
jgi:iron(III) transport system permease protein